MDFSSPQSAIRSSGVLESDAPVPARRNARWEDNGEALPLKLAFVQREGHDVTLSAGARF